MKKYVLGQLEEADAERIELRLLTDPAFGEEFDTIVDEVTDEYVGNELQGDERKRVQQYFLRSTERQNKMRFASELLERAAVERGAAAVAVHPGVFERARTFWATQSFFPRFAITFAVIVIMVGVVLLAWPGSRPPSGSYAAITLGISSSDRAAGAETKSVRLEPDSRGIRIELTVPDQVPQSNSYRVELLDEQQASRDLAVEQQTARSIVVTIPASEITRGDYVIRLYAVNPDGTEQRIRGSYFFRVE